MKFSGEKLISIKNEEKGNYNNIPEKKLAPPIGIKLPNGKMLRVSIAAALGIMILLTLSGEIIANPIPGPIVISAPEADINNLKMYNSDYKEGENKVGIIQEIGKLECPKGQNFIKTIGLGETEIEANIKLDSTHVSDVLIKAKSMIIPQGIIENLKLGKSITSPTQEIDEGEFRNMKIEVRYLSVDSLDYENSDISLNFSST